MSDEQKVNEGHETLRTNGEGDYILDTGSIWIEVGNLSVYIRKCEEGVAVDLYPARNEDSDAIAGTWATYADAIPEGVDECEELRCPACGHKEVRHILDYSDEVYRVVHVCGHEHLMEVNVEEPDAHQRNPEFCAKCGGDCYFDDDGNRIIMNQGLDGMEI